jgi:hypothetical protein
MHREITGMGTGLATRQIQIVLFHILDLPTAFLRRQ